MLSICSWQPRCLATAEVVLDSDDVISRIFDDVDDDKSSSSSSTNYAKSLAEPTNFDPTLLSHDKDFRRDRNHHHSMKPLDSNIPQQYPSHETISEVTLSAETPMQNENPRDRNDVLVDEGVATTGNVWPSEDHLGNRNLNSVTQSADQPELRQNGEKKDSPHEENRHSAPKEKVIEFPTNYGAFKSEARYASNRVEFYVRNFDDEEVEQEEREEKKQRSAADKTDGKFQPLVVEFTEKGEGESSKLEERNRQPQVSWGIPDANAAVGAPFRFPIPANAFLGTDGILGLCNILLDCLSLMVL